MKIFVSLAVVLFAVALVKAMSEEEKKAIETQLLNDCKVKEGGADSDLQLMLNREHPTSPAGKCMSACIAESIGLIKDNKVSIDGAVELAKMLHPGNDMAVEMAKKLANACVSVTGTDRCDFAAKMLKCSEDAAVANGLDPKKVI